MPEQDRGDQAQIPSPLAADSDLFYGFMSLLDEVFDSSEIKSALTDQNLTANRVRMACVAAAGGVLREASAEYAEYAQALTAYGEALSQVRRRDSRDAADRVFRGAARALLVGGAMSTVFGLVVGRWWPAVAFSWRAGLAAVAVGGLAFAMAALRTTEFGVRLLGGEMTGRVGAELDKSRDELLAAVSGEHLLPFVRTLINEARHDALGQEFSVSASPGLSEVYDSAYHVPTEIMNRVDGLVDRLAGGSIGVAGPRGSGKSTVLRRYCEGTGDRPGRDLRCMVSAPVDYMARDFVLYLFATFCRAVRAQLEERRHAREHRSADSWVAGVLGFFWVAVFWSGVGGALLLYQAGVAGALGVGRTLVVYAAVAVFAYGLLRAVERLLAGTGTAVLWLAGVLDSLGAAVFWSGVGGALLLYQAGVAGALGVGRTLVVYAAVAVFAYGLSSGARRLLRTRRWAASTSTRSGRPLKAAAERNLRRVRYLQTRSAGWSGGLKLSVGAEGRRTRETSWAEQPLSYPEIVDEFRVFAREVARHSHREGDRVFIGVDELDKIGSAEQAERFLNEIKGIFGIPHTYFLVSVSDDALTSFERRGLPLRDTFDSSFDEIVQVEPLVYIESRRLIYRRVIGLTEPYIALCHCLSGGLARDLIRAARQVVRVGQALSAGEAVPMIGEIGPALIRDEVHRKIRATTQVIAALADSVDIEPLLERLYAVIHAPAGAGPIAELVREIAAAASAESPQTAVVCRDLAGYLYFCLTLEEVFGPGLDESRLLWASAEGNHHPGHFDTLAAARRTFAHSTHVTWQLIDTFRDAWSLPAIAERS